ncbi:MAG: ShlB/FhaC/HecB family hemolysin secretion/activation protein [Pseudomonadota bacterium]
MAVGRQALVIGLVIPFLVAVGGYATAAQSAGTLLRDTEEVDNVNASGQEMEPGEVEIGTQFRAKLGGELDLVIPIKSFEFIGNKNVSTAELQKLVKGYISKSLTFAELQQVVEKVAGVFRKKGLLAQVYLPPQKIQSGVIKIQITEGKLGGFRIDSQDQSLRVNENFIQNVLKTAESPDGRLDMSTLQNALRTLQELPGISASGTLVPDAKNSLTDVIVRISNKPVTSGYVRTDNSGTQTTGAYRGLGVISFDSPFRRAEQLNLQVAGSTGSLYGRFGGSFPIGYYGYRGGFYLSNLHYAMGGVMKALNAMGNAQAYGLEVTRTLNRTKTFSLIGVVQVERKQYQDSQLSVETDNKYVNAATVRLNIDSLDLVGQGGVNMFNFGLMRGRLNLGGNAADLATDQETTQRQGNFTKLLYSFARTQKISDKTKLWLAFNGQLSSKNLDSSEQYSLGGPTAVRAYPVGEASGDYGCVFTAELRHSVTANAMLVAFADYGHIVLNKNLWSGWNDATPTIPNHYSLKGVGVGARYAKSGSFEASLDVTTNMGANPAVSLLTDGEGDESHHFRAWFFISKYF